MSEGAKVKVPRSIMDAKRQDIEKPVQLEFVDGYDRLPEGLHGHVFVVAPIGDVTSDTSGTQPLSENSFMNGDGMIYRFDFSDADKDCPTNDEAQKNQSEKDKTTVKWKQKIAKPLDYKVDKIIEEKEEENKLTFDKFLKFRNFGMNRYSFLLGFRNQLNVAFLPIKFNDENPERLLLGYDAGRPYEIDPCSLEVIAPVGKISEWETLFERVKQPFPLHLTTPHFVFDQKTKEMFTVNYRRSIANFFNLTIVGIWRWLNSLFVEFKAPKFIGLSRIETIALTIEIGLRLLCKILLSTLNVWNNNFVDLIKWDGKEKLKKWRVVSPSGRRIKIRKSMHDMGFTENYIVLMDTSFTVGIEQLVTDYPESLSFLRKLIRVVPSPDTTLYIINREKLEDDKEEVVAHKVKIKREIIHFAVDYNDCNGEEITLHAGHHCAWDVAEWLRKEDCDSDEMEEMLGMHLGPTDVGLMGRYVIHMNQGKPKFVESEDPNTDNLIRTWGPALYTYNDRYVFSSGTIEKIYWTSLGLWEELTANFILRQYENYRYRRSSISQIEAWAKEGRPSCLFCLDNKSLKEFADYYEFPEGYMGISPQFVPRTKDGGEGPTDGYIVCVVFTPERSEIWIFDAAKLKEGPKCKLSHQDLNMGMSLHTAWLPTIGPRPENSYNVSEEEDYNDLVRQLLEDVSSFYSLSRRQKNSLKTEIMSLFPELYPY